MVAYTYTPCETEGCEYAQDHHGDCLPVEIGKHVLRMRERMFALAYQNRLRSIVGYVEARWLEDLVQEGTSPLLVVGWVSASSSGYKAQRASTWHLDRHCKRNRAMGRLEPVLRLERGGLRPCSGCVPPPTDEEKKRIAVDYRRQWDATNEETKDLCRGQHTDCGFPVVPGKTACEKHASIMTTECYEGRHADCSNVIETKTRPDGSTWDIRCRCVRCKH